MHVDADSTLLDIIAAKEHLFGRPQDFSRKADLTGTCGETMEVYIDLDRDTVRSARCYSNGCLWSRVCLLTAVDLIHGCTVEQAAALNPADIFAVLSDLPAEEHHCADLAVKTVQAALTNGKPPKDA